jgi:hypothetical protein
LFTKLTFPPFTKLAFRPFTKLTFRPFTKFAFRPFTKLTSWFLFKTPARLQNSSWPVYKTPSYLQNAQVRSSVDTCFPPSGVLKPHPTPLVKTAVDTETNYPPHHGFVPFHPKDVQKTQEAQAPFVGTDSDIAYRAGW